MGARLRSSQRTKAATSATPATMGPATPKLVQPFSLPCVRPQTMPSRPVLTRARPGRSSALFGPLLSLRRKKAMGSRAMPMGTLSQKIHCQERPSTTAPPTTGPSATARPAVPLQMPRARPRRAGGTAAERIVRVSGVTTAPPTPCRARAAMSASMLGAIAASAEPEREQRKSCEEHPLAPEPVAQRGARQQQHREGEGVRVDRPLEAREGGPEVLLDHGQRGGHDEVVERHHEHRDGRDHERPDRHRLLTHLTHSPCFVSTLVT